MALTSGTRLGPYEIVEPLGSGGMGEVYRARDPRLGREVAIKLVATDGPPSPDRLRRFETEARAAAALSHPNVVTVFDVGTHEGYPYLVLELLEGETLRETLRSGVPGLRQAVSWALEVSRGLGAAHERGIVHRDLKPENVFLTRDGRVKVLDFGLAKLHETLVSNGADRESPTATKGTSPGVLLGTIGYMSPEQVKGETPDPRTDIFALGTLLYELLTGRKAFGGGTAPEVLASILRDEPPALEGQVPGVPASLEAVVRRCLGKRPSDRFSSARGVEAALETVLAGLEPSRVSLARPTEPRGPYPGLSSFTEADAGRFFGREAEVESLWAKLRQRKLLALIGPSGAGKTSFVRAGLVPSRPSGWGAIVSTPGGAPMRSLAQALVEVLPSDAETMKQLLGFDEPDVAFSMVRKWRESHLEAVLVVDQLEELFTLNPKEVQERFTELLGRLAGDGDVHVLLSLRDDFLMRCDGRDALRPVFGELTPLSPLTPEGLRRALVEPAKREGFAFEDEALVLEMLESVQEARGALPLLAFAVARLWERRDRERKLLTRKAYEEIGGVAGALAQHAEQTLERIGLGREPIVRELFRNLVTAQWTRAVADREELLSVFPDREAGGHVLDQLIDARLLTSYEVREAEAPSRRSGSGVHARDGTQADHEGPSEALRAVPTVSRQRIEIIHESLLRAWPRLVRWQAQDEEGAVLRDQLKQAARLWEDKSRPDDLLWTGTSEREFELWRDRYPGKLTALEDDFAESMLHRTRRRKRLRRMVASSVVVVAVALAAVMGVLWKRARDEARRAEAAGLFSLARPRLAEHPTEALAYATASLERADNPEVRLLALEALWRGPTEFRLPARAPYGIDFSPDGHWLVANDADGTGGALWPSDGGPPTPLEGSNVTMELRFSPAGDRVAGFMDKERLTLGLWSVPDGELVRSFSLDDQGEGGLGLFAISRDGQRILAETLHKEGDRGEHVLRAWPIDGGEPDLLARIPVPPESRFLGPDIDEEWSRLAWADGSRVRVARLEGTSVDLASARSIEHPETVMGLRLDRSGRRLATVSGLDMVRIWSLDRDPAELVGAKRGFVHEAERELRFDPSGSMLASSESLWDLGTAPDAEPLWLQGAPWALAFEPGRRWLATMAAHSNRVSLWPLTRRYPQILRGHAKPSVRIAFTPDGRHLVSTSIDNTVRLWPLVGGVAERSRVLHETEGPYTWFRALTMAPDGSFVALGNNSGQVLVLPLDGGPPRELSGFTDVVEWVAVGPEGRLVAAGAGRFNRAEALVRVWDLQTGGVRILDAGDGVMAGAMRFTDRGELWVRSVQTLRKWDLSGATPCVVDEIDLSRPEFGGGRFEWLTSDGREVLLSKEGRLWIQDLETRATRDLAWYGRERRWLGLDSTGRLVLSTDARGVVRVGSVEGGEPHLFLGHEGPSNEAAVSPDGQWVAASGQDGTIRLWSMPDLSKPPLHTLPHDELIAKLKSLTNLRAVRDPDDPTGWTIEPGPFAGWETVPSW
jgi:serine/threonine protein kinase/WD40 repeat protein